ncbi:unnamed protein product, partial [Pylaiella littoralis]
MTAVRCRRGSDVENFERLIVRCILDVSRGLVGSRRRRRRRPKSRNGNRRRCRRRPKVDGGSGRRRRRPNFVVGRGGRRRRRHLTRNWRLDLEDVSTGGVRSRRRCWGNGRRGRMVLQQAANFHQRFPEQIFTLPCRRMGSVG